MSTHESRSQKVTSNSDGEGGNPCKIIAYRIPHHRRYPEIVPASADREWMDSGTNGWANRCLPLRVANQAGWFILNDADVDFIWGGQRSLDSLKISAKDSNEPSFVSSMFGYGVVTWSIPYLFRTPPGYDLLVRGPSNMFKEGVAPLEGIVETDWVPFTFTMNWKITKALKMVHFSRGEPICMITPIRRGDLDSFGAEIRNLESSPELLNGYTIWHEQRLAKVEEKNKSKEHDRSIQGHYIRGEGYLGERGEGHHTKLSVKPFEEIEPPAIMQGSISSEEGKQRIRWWQKLIGH